MNANEINDKRIEKEFRGVTFSKYKKNDVRKRLIKSITDGKIEESNYWTAELVCAGHYLDLWEIIYLCMSKYIYSANPKLPIYIEMRIDNFREIVTNGYIDNELKMRNNSKIRKLFCEIISILCFSRKNYTYEPVKIKKSEFEMTELSYRLKADKLSYIEPIFMKGDPKELFIAMNEFAYHLSTKISNTTMASYWLEWIIEFECLCKKKKEKIRCERRENIPVESKLQMDIIWMLWDTILYEASKRNKMIKKIIQCLLNLYCLRFSTGIKRKRKYIMYFAITLLTEEINLRKPLIEDRKKVDVIVSSIDNIYKQIKKNEIKPDTDYLFNGLKENNLEKTLDKLDKLNNIGFVPRS